MRRPALSRAPALVLIFGCAFAVTAQRRTAISNAGGVLKGLTIAAFPGSNLNAIQAAAADSNGNIYITGTVNSREFPVKNAVQPDFGDARILRTTDLGASWTPLGSPPEDVSLLIPDPANSEVLFAAGRNGIYKSSDSGKNWRLVYPFIQQYSSAVSLAIDPGHPNLVAAVDPATGNIIRSTDGGETWTAPSPCSGSGCGGGILLADPAGTGTLLSSTLHLSISRDWGQTFEQLKLPGPGSLSAAAFDPSHRGWIYADIGGGTFGSLYLSTDYGATWTQKASPPSTFSSILNLAVDPDDPNALVAATADAFYRSMDGAASWVRESPAGAAPFSPEGHDSFAIMSHRCAPPGGMFAVGGNSQVGFSPDYGQTWGIPHLTHVESAAAGPPLAKTGGCAVYAVRQESTDAFAAKLAPDGEILWSTFLGGSDQDFPAALAVDSAGDVFIAGNTMSADFPATAPEIGEPGRQSVFVTKFSPEGAIDYSALIGGDAIDSASAIAVDGNGNAYILGTTNSLNFPVTPGVLVPAIAPQASAGFLVKISPGAALSYATYLGPMSGKAIIVDTSGQATIAGMGQAPGLPPPPPRTSPQALVKLDAAAAHVLEEIYIPGASGSDSGMALAVDRQGNPIVSGQAEAASFQATSGAYVSPEPVTGCNTGGNLFHSTGMGAYVMKLRAADWQPLYAALITAPCGARPGSMAVDAAGSVILGLVSGQGLPLKTPLLAGPDCSYHSSAIAKLSPDGSGIEFATYLDGCGIPAIALGKNGSLYAGVSPTATNRSMGVLRLPAASSPGISLNGISNAFSGDATAVVAGGLYSIAISGVQTQAVNPGLEPAQNLPTQLGGVRVNFDGAPAPILAVEPGRVIVAAPPGVIHEQGGRDGEASSRPAYGPAFTSVQVFYNDAPSNAVWMPVSDYWPGLLTRDFFNPAVPPDSADGYVLNEDGALNDAAHPAAPGSTISVFATGVGAADPPVDPGAIADSHGAAPAHAIYSSWQRGSLGGIPPGETASTSPGFISAVFQITVEVPDSIASLGGTDAGNEVRRVPLALVPRAPGPYPDPPLSNQVGVYLK